MGRPKKQQNNEKSSQEEEQSLKTNDKKESQASNMKKEKKGQIEKGNSQSGQSSNTTENVKNKRGRKSKKVQIQENEEEDTDIQEFQQVRNENKNSGKRESDKDEQEEDEDQIQQLDIQDYTNLFSKSQLSQLNNRDQQIPQVVQFEQRKEEDYILPYSHEQILSKFEYVQIFSHRVQQLEQNMEPLVQYKDEKGNLKSIDSIVKEEMEQKKLPFLFERRHKNKIKIYNLQDMIILNNHFNENCVHNKQLKQKLQSLTN